MEWTSAALGDPEMVRAHFSPRYDPWDERICVVPEGDLFKAIKKGKASVVTDQIKSFTQEGIALQSGEELTADVIITATGLQMNILGDVEFSVAGDVFDPSESYTYRGFMLSGLPNLVAAFGYTNASFTLRTDLIAEYTCRLLQHMDREHYSEVVPIAPPDMAKLPGSDFQPGYVRRVLDLMPGQGDRQPWVLTNDYYHDKKTLRRDPIEDGNLQFRRRELAQSA